VRALIIGGGLGGVAAGIALRRVGIDAVVFERGSSLQALQAGAGMHLWPNAMKVVREFGVEDQMTAAGSPEELMEFWSTRGRRLAAFDVGAWGRTLGAPMLSIRRALIHEVLVEALGDGGLEFGAEVASFEQNGSGRDGAGVIARFTNGREEHGDFLVGADGLNSAVRAHLLGAQPPRYAGYTAWQAFVRLEHPRAPVGHMPAFWGPGARFLYFHVDPDVLCWVAIANAPEGAQDPPGDIRAHLLGRYAGWPEPTEALIGASEPAQIGRLDVYDRRPVKRWGTGRVTMLGDAAHPMTFNVGQGACMAIEDALVLSKCVRDQDDVPAALRRYEQQRMGRTAGITRISWALGRGARWERPAAVRFRDVLMSIAFPLIADPTTRKFCAYEA
jgi:2-polyprenyl-6-methoxyphenol hydroxylase-like FAD-dependent oxidoreductase